MTRSKAFKPRSNLSRGLPRSYALATRARSSREQVSMVRGFSLIEMLIVVAVFSILAVVATQSLSSSLRGSKKSESQVIVRENVDFALSTMERLLRNADNLNCASSDANTLVYIDEYGNSVRFDCSSGSISSESSTLTSPDIEVDCTSVFTCNNTSIPHSVDITIKAERTGITGAEGSQITETTKILLRNY
ncbi:hypothetical protein A2865_00040 [Candidatus Woesebacteria bacterium RIFCSPHIGHO2_01_FULL_39_17]|nr:MAG: hypothetical protein A2865_00040 [Candidatus Woesebacteria bacterium RIFCSPHIGHO2_01_FULL_39_17]